MSINRIWPGSPFESPSPLMVQRGKRFRTLKWGKSFIIRPLYFAGITTSRRKPGKEFPLTRSTKIDKMQLMSLAEEIVESLRQKGKWDAGQIS